MTLKIIGEIFDPNNHDGKLMKEIKNIICFLFGHKEIHKAGFTQMSTNRPCIVHYCTRCLKSFGKEVQETIL